MVRIFIAGKRRERRAHVDPGYNRLVKKNPRLDRDYSTEAEKGFVIPGGFLRVNYK